MGKKLTELQISEMIAAKPNSQMFDICCVCEGTEAYMEMNDAGDPDTFDVICDECLAKTKKGEITSMLIDIFDKIGIQTPGNFDQILEYVFEDVCLRADQKEWSDRDVAFSFKLWIESNSK
jgi:hypothetical protein